MGLKLSILEYYEVLVDLVGLVTVTLTPNSLCKNKCQKTFPGEGKSTLYCSVGRPLVNLILNIFEMCL